LNLCSSTPKKAVCTVASFFLLTSTHPNQMKQPVSTNLLPAIPFSANYPSEQSYNRSINIVWDGTFVMTPQIAENLCCLREIECLEDNWNGNGASAFSKNLIEKTKSLICSLTLQPMIFPTARGSIQMEYETERGDYLELELFEDGRLKAFQYHSDGKTETKDIPISSANEVILNFYDRNI